MEEFRKRFIIRSVAGSHYLIDIGQPGLPYKKPLCLNEMGADICSLILEGKSIEDLVSILSKEYGVSPGEFREDIKPFISSLSNI